MGHHTPESLLDGGFGGLGTQVREPRARLLSLYRYWQTLPDAIIDSWGVWGTTALRAAALPLERFLSSAPAWVATDNAVARQLLSLDAVPPPSARRLLERALRGDGYRTLRDNLRVAEWSRDSQRFADRICEAIGVPTTVVDRVNETPVVHDGQRLGPVALAMLDDRTTIDRELLDRLMADGLVAARSVEDLDTEWKETAERLGFGLD